MNNIIDKNYTEQYKQLHSSKQTYGASSVNYLDEASLVINYLKPKIVLDYGCGKGALMNKLAALYPEISFYGYDPSIPGLEEIPVQKADLIINTDVLEHIPENILPNVVEKISSISQNVFFVLHHGPASNILPNGENAHCTIKSPFWYKNLFLKYFRNLKILEQLNPINTTAITFDVDQTFIDQYNSIILKNLKDKYKINKKNYLKYKSLSFFSFNLIKKIRSLKQFYRSEANNINARLKIYDFINRIKLEDYLNNKSIAIVGNAESIFKNEYGTDIDQHDIVIRFNRGIIKDQKCQGSKTNIWCGACNNGNEQFIEQYFSPELIIWMDNDCLFNNYINKSSKTFLSKLFYYNNSFYNELKYDKNSASLILNNKKYTFGFRIIDFLAKYINFSKLSIYGFDFFKTNTFYNNGGELEIIKNNKVHDFKFEEENIMKIVENNDKIKIF